MTAQPIHYTRPLQLPRGGWLQGGRGSDGRNVGYPLAVNSFCNALTSSCAVPGKIRARRRLSSLLHPPWI